MFVRTKKTPNTAKTAVQLVDNVREGKKIKQKLIRHFGYALNEEEVKALINIAERYKIELEQKTLPALFAKDNLIALIDVGNKKAETDNSPLPVNLRDIKEEKRIRIGIHQAYGKLFDLIGFGRVIKNPLRKKASVGLLRDMVMARIANPVSKRGSVQMLEREYGISADVHAVYRMMDFLDDDAIDKVRQLSYTYTKDLLKESIKIIFYDCTTLYFESFIEDDLKQNGYSKDGKFNQSQVLLAIMVTESGLPLGYELFEGSKFEGHTLDNALDQLHQRYQTDQIIFVADAALLNSDNIEKFHKNNQPFIVGARLKNMSKPVTEKILNKKDYSLLYDKDDSQEAVTYKHIPITEEGLHLIVTYSPKRAAKDKHDREKAIESLTNRIAKSNNPTALLNNFGYKKFVTLEGEAKLVVDKQKIKDAELWDGLHGIITNINNIGADKIEMEQAQAIDKKEDATSQSIGVQQIQKLLGYYKGLWQVEETFRISKHDLRMRPVFHWTPNRIKAHIAICFMALMCVRAIEYLVRLQYKKLSPAAIKYELMHLETSILKDIKTQKQYALPSRASQDAKKIYQVLGLKWNDTPFLIKENIIQLKILK